MIFHDLPQQSEEWFRARLGLATASKFGEIITPATAQFSASAQGYAEQLVGEMVTGTNEETFQSYWMERGALMEADARCQYEALTELVCDRGGFITNDAMTWGASPDVRVFDGVSLRGGAEIKCPKTSTHIANLRRATLQGKIDPKNKPQVQGQIFVGGFEFMDWFSYHPDFPPAWIRTYRDDAFCTELEKCLEQFDGLVEGVIDMLEKMGMTIPPRPITTMKPAEPAPSVYMAG